MDTTNTPAVQAGQQYRETDSGDVITVTRVTGSFVYVGDRAYLADDFAEGVGAGRLTLIEPSPARIANVLTDWRGREVVLKDGRKVIISEHRHGTVRLMLADGPNVGDSIWQNDAAVWYGLEYGEILTPDQIEPVTLIDATPAQAMELLRDVAAKADAKAFKVGDVVKIVAGVHKHTRGRITAISTTGRYGVAGPGGKTIWVRPEQVRKTSKTYEVMTEVRSTDGSQWQCIAVEEIEAVSFADAKKSLPSEPSGLEPGTTWRVKLQEIATGGRSHVETGTTAPLCPVCQFGAADAEHNTPLGHRCYGGRPTAN